jgi:tetratricopeptide (TPR) repeat protein
MGFAPASPRCGRWKTVSLIAATVLALAGGVAAPDPVRTVLAFPARGHWMLEPLREKLSEALPEALREAGFEVTTARPDNPLVLEARRERPLAVGVEATPEQLEEGRYVLAVLGGFDAVLTVEVTGGDAGAVVQAELAGAVSRRPVRLEATSGSMDPSAAEDLAKRLAAAITPEVWQEAGADAEGRRAGAAERYAAGRAAMEAGRYRDAREQFEAALAGEAENPDYLRAAAEADLRCGDAEEALSHLQTAARLHPDDAEVRLSVGEAALQVGRLELAEANFRAVDRMRPDDPRAVEGLARTYRAGGDVARARSQYQRLMGLIPALREEPISLVSLLAGLRTDRVRFAGLSDDEATRALALLYLEEGETERGIGLLYRYHQAAARPAYNDADYETVARRMDEQATLLARLAEELLRLARPSDADDAGMERGLDETHNRSERLASLAERMQVSPREDPAHRYRVLAYNLLNESNFEALLYSRTNDASHERRASLLREASRKAEREAETLDGRGSGIGDRGSGTAGGQLEEAPSGPAAREEAAPEAGAGEEVAPEAGAEEAPSAPAGEETGAEEAPSAPAAGEDTAPEAGAGHAPPQPLAEGDAGPEAGAEEAPPEPASPTD